MYILCVVIVYVLMIRSFGAEREINEWLEVRIVFLLQKSRFENF